MSDWELICLLGGATIGYVLGFLIGSHLEWRKAQEQINDLFIK